MHANLQNALPTRISFWHSSQATVWMTRQTVCIHRTQFCNESMFFCYLTRWLHEKFVQDPDKFWCSWHLLTIRYLDGRLHIPHPDMSQMYPFGSKIREQSSRWGDGSASSRCGRSTSTDTDWKRGREKQRPAALREYLDILSRHCLLDIVWLFVWQHICLLQSSKHSVVFPADLLEEHMRRASWNCHFWVYGEQKRTANQLSSHSNHTAMMLVSSQHCNDVTRSWFIHLMLYLTEILPIRGPVSRKPRPYRWGLTYESCLWWDRAETCLVTSSSARSEMSPTKNETSITKSGICWQSMKGYSFSSALTLKFDGFCLNHPLPSGNLT